MNKPAKADRPNRNNNLKPVGDAPTPAEKKERKPRASGGDFNAELRALADKHRKRSSKLRSTVEKLESKLSVARRQLDTADEPLRKIERVLADNPELPGVHAFNESAGGMDLSGPPAREDHAMASSTNAVASAEVSP